MDKDKVFDFYEKTYFRELDEMNTILSRFPILIAGSALIINAYIFLFRFKQLDQLNIHLKFLFIILIVSAVSGLLFCLFKTFQTKLFETIEPLDKLESKRQAYISAETQIEDRNKKVADGHQQKEISADDLFHNDLQNKFIKCTGTNQMGNNERRMWFHKSLFLIWINLALCITIPIIIIVISSWSFNMPDKEDDIPLVDIPEETGTLRMENAIPATESYSEKGESEGSTSSQQNEKE